MPACLTVNKSPSFYSGWGGRLSTGAILSLRSRSLSGIYMNHACHRLEQDQKHIQVRNINLHARQTCRPVALEYDPAGHGAQTDDDVAPAVGSVQ